MENIKEKFKQVISYSQGIEDPKVDDLFEKWKEAKRDFIEAFDNKLIWEWPETVSFELSEKAKKEKINNFIDRLYDNYRVPELAAFIVAEKEGFYSNRVVKDYKYDKNTIIKEGMKISKAFKFFTEDKELLDKLQIEMSMILQEDKISGKLCLSVHPLDFLSTSETTYNWRSCHALNGEYKAGNLSYMVDSSTIICYLKSDKDQILPDFPNSVPWNAKKWRVLLFFSDMWDVLFAGRQYPFTTHTGIDFVRDRVLPAARLGTWSEWNDKRINNFELNYTKMDNQKNFDELATFFPHVALDDDYIPIGRKLKGIKEIVIDKPNSLQFNDLLSSSCYKPIYSFKLWEDSWGYKKIVAKDTSKVKIGGGVKCLKCENKLIQISETMMCNDCELKYGSLEDDTFSTCPCCGDRFYAEEGVWLSYNDEVLCPSCADNYVEVCANCEELRYKEDLIYSKKYQNWLCPCCYQDIEEDY